MVIKIPLLKAVSLGYERDMVTFSVKYGSLPNFHSSAILDTGCPFCVISENTIQKTRINYKDKPVHHKQVWLGGIFFELRSLGECELFFRDNENKPISFKQEVYVGVPISLKKGTILSQQIPCFIGKDFLDKNFLSIIRSKDGNTYLQEVD